VADGSQDKDTQRGDGDSESLGTVLIALAANLLIALAKLVGGLISGSSSMMAEAAHSVADTMNQVFLLRSLKVSRRPADAEHPFGYGKDRFFWSLLAAMGIFVAGAVFSVYEGVHTLLHGSETGGILIAFAVLAVALVAEGTSWLRAVRQVRAEARRNGRGVLAEIRQSADPTVKTVVSEDSAAVVGILLAAIGLGMRQATGQAWWDGAAAIAIGVLLAVVAILLGRDTRELVIGRSADPELVVGVYDHLCAAPEVAHVVELLTMHLGPETVMVAARIDLQDQLSGDQVEDFSSRIERELADRWPTVRQVFLDATRTETGTAARTEALVRRLRQPSDASAVEPAGV
jgi:cation diffusion facilitator family transporter